VAELFRMPEVTATATSAVLSQWIVPEGGSYERDAVLAVIETDKAQVDVAADVAGVLLKTLVAEGTEADVGAPIALLGRDGEGEADVADLLARFGLAGEPAAQSPPATGPGGRDTAASGPGSRAHGDGADSTPARRFTSPLARKMAREAGLSLDGISGTGPGGRIIRKDVQAALDDRAAAASVPEPGHASPPASPPRKDSASVPASAPVSVPPVTVDSSRRPVAAAEHEDVAHSRMRTAIARRLVASKREVPHFYLRTTCRLEPLLVLKQDVLDGSGTKLSVTDLLVKAVALAHTRVPAMNVVWTQDAVRTFSAVDIGVAVATTDGLVVPVLRGVESKTATAVSADIKAMAEQARAGRLRPDQMEGGAITVTNLGMFRVEEFAAIINPPQSAILAVGAAREEPVVEQGTVQVGTTMRLTLSVDHRPVDGVVAAEWLDTLKGIVEEPLQILT
jgi:pyruvate dehydrogenase E2 component (dihydrolipoamide acetyltransferase)